MDVDDDGVRAVAQGTGRKLPLDGRKRIIERIHEDAAERAHHEDAPTVPGIEHGGAAAGRSGGIIDRPDQARRPLDEHQCLALVPGVIAERDRVRADIDELVIDRLGDAEPAGGILAVDDDEIELPVGDQRRQALLHDSASAAPDDVADKQDAHPFKPRGSR